MSILRTRGLSKRFFRAERDALADLDLELGRGDILAVLGESGSGKTTLLRLIAGLERPSGGTIEIGGNIVFDGRRSVPPERRGVGLVFQENSLFPHLRVEQNVRFGLHRLPAADQRRRAREMLALVGLEGLADRFPHELSGGQQQRVALARALAPAPTVLLLDEPFSNLDVVLKHVVRDEVVEIIRRSGTTAIFVLHDADDALSVADRVAVLRDGRLQQVADPQTLYLQPANEYVARFFGRLNVLSAVPCEQGYCTAIGCVALSREECPQRGPVMLTARPESIVIGDRTEGSAPGQVREVRYLGDRCELTIRVEGPDGTTTDVILYTPPDRAPTMGEIVQVGLVGPVRVLSTK